MEALRCLICNRQVNFKRLIDLKDLVSFETFFLDKCPECGVLQTVPIPSELGMYYSSDVGLAMRSKPNKVHSFMKKILLNTELQRIRKHLMPESVVDIGCGIGDFAALIHERGLKVTAVDSDEQRPVMISGLNDIGYCRINFDSYEIEGLNPNTGYTVVLRHVLEHIKDPARFLQTLLDKGTASFYIAVPNSACIERHVFGRSWGLWDPPRHLWHFNRSSLEALCQRLNLKIVGVGYDTIPGIIPSFYRYMRIRGFSERIYRPFRPMGAISSLFYPFNIFLPFNVIWLAAKKKD